MNCDRFDSNCLIFLEFFTKQCINIWKSIMESITKDRAKTLYCYDTIKSVEKCIFCIYRHLSASVLNSKFTCNINPACLKRELKCNFLKMDPSYDFLLDFSLSYFQMFSSWCNSTNFRQMVDRATTENQLGNVCQKPATC